MKRSVVKMFVFLLALLQGRSFKSRGLRKGKEMLFSQRREGFCNHGHAYEKGDDGSDISKLTFRALQLRKAVSRIVVAAALTSMSASEPPMRIGVSRVRAEEVVEIDAIEITNPISEVSEFFNFGKKLKNNQINKERASAAEKEQLKKDGIANFKSFSEEAIVNLQKESVAGDNVYADSTNGYYFKYPSTWKLTKRDKIPQASGQYAVERVMVVGNNFAEGSSLSVTRTAPTRLLKDFDVEWWFAPLRSMKDLGSADLIARLLVLQRQGEFEKKVTTSIITNAVIKDNVLEFEFLTPLPGLREVKRKTAVRCIFKAPSEQDTVGRLDTLWISALSDVFDSEIGGKELYGLRNSFYLQ